MKNKNIAQEIANERPKDLVLEVTVKRTYIITSDALVQFDKPSQLVKDWFKDFPIHRHHASRDYSHIGGMDKIVKIKTIKAKK